MDNGSSHRGARSDARLSRRWPTITPVHTPVHASWLDQVEIYFSIIQAKVLTLNDFSSLALTKPFEWKFTRQDLSDLMARLSDTRRSSP